MIDPVVAKIEANPKYHELRRKRNTFGWLLTAVMMVVYYGYIALIAFNKPFLAQPIGDGVTSLGIPLGMAVIVFTIAITAPPCNVPLRLISCGEASISASIRSGWADRMRRPR